MSTFFSAVDIPTHLEDVGPVGLLRISGNNLMFELLHTTDEEERILEAPPAPNLRCYIRLHPDSTAGVGEELWVVSPTGFGVVAGEAEDTAIFGGADGQQLTLISVPSDEVAGTSRWIVLANYGSVTF